MKQRNLIAWAFLVWSAVYATLIVSVRWDDVRGSAFRDIENYLNRLDQLERYGLTHFDFGETLLDYMMSEYLWSWTLFWMTEQGYASQVILLNLSAYTAFVSHAFLARHIGGVSAALLLLNPISIDLYFSQIRSAFSFSLVLTALWIIDTRATRWPAYALLIISPYFHASMALMIGILLFTRQLAQRIRWSKVQIATFAVVSAIGFVTLLHLYGISAVQTLQDRRSFSSEGTRSVAYVAFWLFLSGTLLVSVTNENIRSWRYVFAIFINIFAALAEISGLPFFRLIALSIPITLSTLPMIRPLNRRFLLGCLVLYGMLLFSYWLRGYLSHPG